MIADNKNSEIHSAEFKDSVLKECLYDFCFSPLGTTAASILKESYQKTNVVTAKSTFSRHMGAKVLIENNETLSLQDIRTNEIVPIVGGKSCVDGNTTPDLNPVKEKVKKVLQNLFATKNNNIARQRREIHQKNRLLTENEEKFLVQLCKCLAYSGYGLECSEVLSVMNVISPLPDKKSHSNHAFTNFMKRNPDSAQPRMRRGDRAAVRRPVRRHLLMAPRPDRRALERLCGTRGPMTARAARVHRPAAGATGEGGSSRLLPFFCCFNVSVVETVHVDFIAVFSLPHHPPFAVHTPAFQAGFGVARWALAPCCAGAMPAINSAGKAAAPRQEETEQEGERGQSPRQRGLYG
jgi:hypothetical protein